MNQHFFNHRLLRAFWALVLFGLLLGRTHAQLGLPPSITVQPLDQTVPKGGTASFVVTAASTTTMSYQWYKNSNVIVGATSSTYTRSNVDLPDSGYYHVVIANAAGTTTSSKALLTVLGPPVITTQPQSQSVTQRLNATFSVVASGGAPLLYQWSFNGLPLFGATNTSLTLSNVQAGDAGSYNVTVSNALGTTNSSTATLTVLFDWLRTVVNTNDSGAGSLRQAILDSTGGGSGSKKISFNITNAPAGGPYTINLLSALPALANNTTIDGYTQPGASKNTLSNGNNAVLKISLSGTDAGASDGMTIGLAGCAIYGLAIVNFPGNGIRTSSFGDPIIQGNFIGLDLDGITARGNSGAGIRCTGPTATIGGSARWKRNVISGNLGGGITALNSANNIIQGNFIGTDASGTLPRGNSGSAVQLLNPNSGGTLIGGSQPGEGNVIAAATGTSLNNHGIYVLNSTGNKIQGNYIGTDFTGSRALGNRGCGILLTNATINNLIGGTNAGAANVIAYNSLAGVWVGSGTNNGVLGNSIYANDGLGIDLGSGGVQANDLNDTDLGANELQNYPVLGTPFVHAGILQIIGSLQSRTNSSYRIEFFSSPLPDTASNGEGKNFLGAINTSIATTAAVYFAIGFSSFPTNNTVVTATATDPANNTSEFSAWRAITYPDVDITNQPQSQAVAVGESATFSVGASGAAPFSYQWSFNGTPLPGATNSVFTTGSAQPNNEGNYTVVVRNAWNAETSGVARLTVLLPPLAVDDTATVAEDTSVSINVLLNDTDPNGRPLSLTSVSTTNGTAIVSGTNVIFRASTNYNGTVILAYTIYDGLYSATGKVTVTVSAVNDVPLALSDSTNTLEDTSVTIPVLANDSDVEGTVLSLVSASTTNGTAIVSATNVVFTPATNYFGNVVFTYRTSDGSNFATGAATVVVAPVNDGPVAGTNLYSTPEDVPLTVPAPGVLADDWDVEGDPFTALLVTDVANGSLVLNPDGSFTYTPEADFSGSDSFSYRGTDGLALGNVVTVTLNVTPVVDLLRFVAQERVTNGMRLELSGPRASFYVIRASSNFTDWTPLSTNFAPQGNLVFIDPKATSQRDCFYQAMISAPTNIQQNETGGTKVEIDPLLPGAQSFRYGTNGGPGYGISKIVIRISRDGPLAPNGNLIFSLGTGVNTGPIAGSTFAITPGSVTNSTSGTNFQRYEIVLPEPIGPLTAGTTYYLNFICQSTNGEEYWLERSSGVSTYGPGTFYSVGGDLGRDMRFELWGQ